MTEILVRFYGRLAEEAQPSCSVDAPQEGITVGNLRKALAERFRSPLLLDLRVKTAVGDDMVDETRIVRAGEEVDFLAPLSGG